MILMPILGLAISIVLSGFILILSGNSPLRVFGTIFKGAFGSVYGITSILRWMTPLLFLGVSASFSLRAGLWNIGMEGQMYLGAIFGAWVGFSLPGAPGPLIVILAILLAAVVGAAWALSPALLRAYFGTNEFITTLLLNFVAVNLTNFLTLNLWQDVSRGGETQSTPEVPSTARLLHFLPNYAWNLGFVIGLAVIVLYFVVIRRTSFGYEAGIHGRNPKFLKYGGISVKKTIVFSMCISGAVAGIAGAVEILGVYKSFFTGMFSGGVAWDGLVVGLLGLFNPAGIMLAAFFYGFLKISLLTMERMADISRAVVTVVQAVLVFFVAVQGVALAERRQEKRGE